MEVKKVFDGKVAYIHAGTEIGGYWTYERIWQVAKLLDVTEVFVPTLDFTNRVVAFGYSPFNFNIHKLTPEENLWRTYESADGGIVCGMYWIGLVIYNADCHIGIIFDHYLRKLCLVHLGLGYFFREDSSPSILENAIKAMGSSADNLLFWFGGGIGPCCNGYNHTDPKNLERAQKIQNKFSKDVIKGEVKYGPRKGQVAYHNGLMIIRLAEEIGFKEIQFDLTCTSCHGLTDPNVADYGTYFSNVRDLEKRSKRNCFMAKML